MKHRMYRARGSKSGKWYYGYLVGSSIVEDYSGTADPFDKKAWYAIDPDTVGQYVQPYYKDNNDIGLWEGDIVLVTDEDYVDEPTKAVVRWGGDNYPALDLYVKSENGYKPLVLEFNSFTLNLDLEIIGNIYEGENQTS